MFVLLIGGGAREHAIAWKLLQSPRVERLFVAPGNGGTVVLPNCVNLPIEADDLDGLLDFAHWNKIDLTIVGPEAPLVAGIVDRFHAAGLRIVGPTQAAAQLEGSKAFAKRFMLEHDIPTARAEIVDEYEAARAALRASEALPVIKLSGLAAGKGVYVPDTLDEAERALHEIFVERRFGAEPPVALIEERLEGPELSLLAFCDGERFHLMPAAQDHKRLLDDDRGPNTGGMGAYAPAPLATDELMADAARTIFEPTLAGMRARGTPYRGILYAGLMLTDAGPKVLEFNCRFGDPEAQVLIPLLESDLLPLLEGCADGSLADIEPQWRPGASATVVIAMHGYPDRFRKGAPIYGIVDVATQPRMIAFQGGTLLGPSGPVSNGGRVLSITGLGDTLSDAVSWAYDGVVRVRFEGAHFRRDIGAKALRHQSKAKGASAPDTHESL